MRTLSLRPVALSLLISLASSGPAFAAGQITFVSQGGSYQEAQTKAILDPAAKLLGITVNQDSIPDAWPAIKAQGATGKPIWDVVDTPTSNCLRGGREGLLEKLDFSKLPNAAAMPEQYRTPYPVAYEFYSTVIGYNKKTLKKDLRFQLISGRIGGPLVDVDLGMRFMTQDEIGANSVLVMPEVLLPVCNRRYHEQALLDEAGTHGDTVIVMDDGERGWHDRFSAVGPHKRRAASMLNFDDYTTVVQAALPVQGIALGWLNVVSHWLAEGALLPAEQELLVTSRRCCPVSPESRPMRPVVEAIHDWIVEETLPDLRTVDQAYPALGIRDALKGAGLVLG